MKNKQILGHIDCPTCGTAKGMRLTPDNNGDPFGFCEANCGQQLRIGGDKRRVRDFVARHPWAVTDTDAGAASAKASAPPPATFKTPVTEKKPPAKPVPDKPKAAGVFDFLLQPGATA